MGYRDYENTPRHSGNRSTRGDSRRAAPSQSSSRSRSSSRSSASRPRREELRDNYYYEEPPRNWQEGDQFQDISSYSSPRKRREDQRTMESQRRSGGRKKKGSLGRKIAVTFLVLLILIGGGLFYVFGYLLNGLTMTTITKDPTELGIQDGVMSDSKITNIALFGLDARENEDVGRSDALMILTIDQRHGKLKITSILRDSEVNIDGYGSDKITHAYAYGGPELAIKTLNQNYNLDIEDYVTVNFIQMAEIVDAFGGVEINVTDDEMTEINNNLAMQQAESADANIVDSDYLSQSGDLLLNGNQAVAYARIRHLDSDDVRASRQQEVLMGLVKRLKSKNILEYPNLIRKVMPMCETSLDFGDIMGMAPFMLTNFEMETMSIPGDEEQPYGAYNDAGAWVYRYDIAAASQHISRFIYEEDSPYYTGSSGE